MKISKELLDGITCHPILTASPHEELIWAVDRSLSTVLSNVEDNGDSFQLAVILNNLTDDCDELDGSVEATA